MPYIDNEGRCSVRSTITVLFTDITETNNHLTPFWMGMPIANPVKESAGSSHRRIRYGSAPALKAATSEAMLDRKLSVSELPPIGIKPRSPSYSPKLRVHTDLNHNQNGNHVNSRRSRKSPLSPTSTSSSNGGSNRSVHFSPSSGMVRSKTWTGDLNSSQHGSTSKLETLYENGHMTGVEPKIGERSLSTTITALTAGALPPGITSPPHIDRHIHIKSTETVLPAPKQNPSNTEKLPATNPSAKTQLTVNRLSSENLKKLRHSSGASSENRKPTSASRSADTGYDSDEEKTTMIVKWIMEVETSATESPPEVSVPDTTEKRDTAIHIIYEGD